MIWPRANEARPRIENTVKQVCPLPLKRFAANGA